MRSQLPRFPRARGGAVSALALLLLAVACEAKLPTAAEISEMDVAAAETRARHISLLAADGEEAEYAVDGERVSAEAARALRPDEIGSIFVVRSNKPGEKAAILITRPHSAQERSTRELDPVPPGGTRLRTGHVERADDPAFARGPVGVRLEREFEGVVLVDGARADAAALGLFPPGEILSVEVLKGDAATAAYPAPEAANGVVRITTRKGSAAK